MSFDINSLSPEDLAYEQSLENLNGGLSTDLGNSSNYMQLIGNAMNVFQSLSMMNQGIDLAKQGADFQAGVYRASGKAAIQGANFQASVYRQAGAAAIMAANYNIALDQLQTGRQQDALGRQLSDAISSNQAKIATTGFSFGSKSTMLVQSAIMTSAERTFAQNTSDAKQRQDLIAFQGQLSQTQYENQARAAEYSGLVQAQSAENSARAAEYSGAVDAYKMESQQAQQIGQSVGNIFKMFGE